MIKGTVYLESAIPLSGPQRVFLRVLDGNHELVINVSLTGDDVLTLMSGGAIITTSDRRN